MPSPETSRPAAPADAATPADVDASAKLDTRSLLCPLPVLLTAREIAGLPPGARLVVEGDDRGILEDLPAWCAATGHRLVEIGEVAAEPAKSSKGADSSRVLIRAVVEKATG